MDLTIVNNVHMNAVHYGEWPTRTADAHAPHTERVRALTAEAGTPE